MSIQLIDVRQYSGLYLPLTDNGFPWIQNCLSDKALGIKQEVLNYLEFSVNFSVIYDLEIDVIDPKYVIESGISYFSDGIFFWDSALIYYAKKYNLKLPKAFIECMKFLKFSPPNLFSREILEKNHNDIIKNLIDLNLHEISFSDLYNTHLKYILQSI